MDGAATSSPSVSRRALFVLLIASIILVALLVRPFAVALLLAAVMAATLWPLQRRLSTLFRGRQGPAALVVIVAVVLLTIGPLVTLSAFVVKEAADATRWVTQTIRSEGFDVFLGRLPDPVERAARELFEHLPLDESGHNGGPSLQDQVTKSSGKAAAAVGRVVAATGTLLFQTAIALIALYFFLTEKKEILRWIDRVSPLAQRHTRELLEEFRRVSVGVLRSTVLTSLVQAVVATIGYLIARVPYAVFFGALTFFVALVPAIGAAGVCLLCAGLLFVTGNPGWAIFLTAWGLIVVGLSDNVVKPWLLKGDVGMHGAVVFFSLLGGLAAFGTIGLLLGPLAMAFFIAVLRIYRRDYPAAAPQ